jgi:hypothetical protein
MGEREGGKKDGRKERRKEEGREGGGEGRENGRKKGRKEGRKINHDGSQTQWLAPVILSIWEAESRRTEIQVQPGYKMKNLLEK